MKSQAKLQTRRDQECHRTMDVPLVGYQRVNTQFYASYEAYEVTELTLSIFTFPLS